MPIYSYEKCCTKKDTERNVPMDERDNQWCECGDKLDRLVTFNGSVWAPSSTGGHKR